MSGHSKWSTIKRKKGAIDAQRGKIFTKLVREISTATRLGGPDPDANPRLRVAIISAKAASMPGNNIERAIKKASGEGGADTIDEVVYEGYGADGVAVIIEAQTDNRNRTSSEIRFAFTKNKGNLGAQGSVAYMFHKHGQFTFDVAKHSEDEVMEVALDCGAEDVMLEDDRVMALCAPGDFAQVLTGFDKAGLVYENAEFTMIPENTIHVTGDAVKQVLRLIEKLEDLDDVQTVYTNFDADDDDIAAALES